LEWKWRHKNKISREKSSWWSVENLMQREGDIGGALRLGDGSGFYRDSNNVLCLRYMLLSIYYMYVGTVLIDCTVPVVHNCNARLSAGNMNPISKKKPIPIQDI
jgi:hypothetical protein